jgi:nicotinamide-nucleotide amidase
VTPEQAIGSRLRELHLTIATAESCTGGLVSDRLTDVPGSSDYFQGGVVAYANKVKTNLLGVKPAVLRRHGAVSRETVVQMAAGTRRRFRVDVAIAVSGIAGPGGGTRTKPVGLVWMAVAAGERVAVEQHRFRGSRRQVKTRAAQAALRLCLNTLEAI